MYCILTMGSRKASPDHIVNVPDDVDVKMFIKVAESSQMWQCIGTTKDIDWRLEDCEKPEWCSNVSSFIPPNLFIDRDDEGKLIPDFRYLPLINRCFINQMMVYWKAENRLQWNDLLKEIEKNMEYLFDCVPVHDILT